METKHKVATCLVRFGSRKKITDKVCTILARVKEFSKIQLQTPVDEVRVDYSRSNNRFYEFRFRVYPHGYRCSAEGFVSIVLTKDFEQEEGFRTATWQLTSVINVIDDEGSEKFPQSFVVSSQSLLDENQEEFVIDKYISRSVLLDDDHLLPDDTLTLKVDIGFRSAVETRRPRKGFTGSWSRSDSEKHKGKVPRIGSGCASVPAFDRDLREVNGRVLLRLNSLFAHRLADESRYFERLRATPMMERSTNRVMLPGNEYRSFDKIRNILFEVEDVPISFESIGEIFELYATADKYDIGIVTDNCRSWLKRCLTRENAAETLEFAESYGDDRLKEDVKLFLWRVENGYVTDDGVPSNATGMSERSHSAATENSGNTTLEFRQENKKSERDEYSFYF